MSCPTCGSDNIQNQVEQTFQCENCGCCFLNDGEVTEKWQYCVECGNYTAPEDKPRHGKPICQRCSERMKL